MNLLQTSSKLLLICAVTERELLTALRQWGVGRVLNDTVNTAQAQSTKDGML